MRKENSLIRKWRLIALSAKTEAGLDKLTRDFVEYLRENPGLSLADVGYSLLKEQNPFKHRKVAVCTDINETIAALSSIDGKLSSYPGNLRRFYTRRFDRRAVFMFPGQGSQYINMGLGLYKEIFRFRETMERCFTILKPILGMDIKKILYPAGSTTEAEERICRQEFIQVLFFAFEYALARLLMHWGINPKVMIGYSIGEYVAACIAGVFSLEDALQLVALRGKLLQELPTGTMLSVPLSEEKLRPLMNKDLSLAAVNGPSCIVAGVDDAIHAFENELKHKKCLCTRLNISHAGHSQMLDSVLEKYEEKVSRVRLLKPGIPFISSTTGNWIKDEEAVDPAYWTNHLRKTVRFSAGIDILLKERGSIFIEIGPGRDLSMLVKRQLDRNSPHQVLNLVRPRQIEGDDVLYLMSKMGDLWLYGTTIDTEKFYAGEERKFIRFPAKLFEPGYTGNRENDRKEGKERELSAAGKRPNILSRYVAPGDRYERVLVDIAENLLDCRYIGVQDDFFELGGDSLKAVSFMNLIQKELGIKVPLFEIFKRSTIAGLAEYLNGAKECRYSAMASPEKKEYYRLSSAQKRIYFLQQMDVNGTYYNAPYIFHLKGNVCKTRIEDLFVRLINRHESLRTSFFIKEDEPVQRVNKTVDFTVACHGPVDEQGTTNYWQEAEKVIHDFIKPFDLSQTPLLRVGLISPPRLLHDYADRDENRGVDEYVFMVDMHHIISDGTSVGILIKEFMKSYNEEELPALRIQYNSFSEWQNKEKEKQSLPAQQEFWTRQFAGEIPVLELPADYVRPKTKSFAGDRLDLKISGEETGKLKTLALQEEATLFMVLLAVFNVLLCRFSGQEDIIVGTPAAGREHPDLGSIIGMFVNTLALRNFPSAEKTYIELLRDVKEGAIAAFENQNFQFDDLINNLAIERDPGRNPLFDVLFAVYELGISEINTPGLKLKTFNFHNKISKFDLMFIGREEGDNIFFAVEYCTTLFKSETIAKIISSFKLVVSEVIKNPGLKISEIDLITAEEKSRIISDFNNTTTAYPKDKTLHGLFEEQVEKRPCKIATVFRDKIVSYKELSMRAGQQAINLKGKGVQKGSIVGIIFEPSIDMIIGILAILKAGGAYLPIDVKYPLSRKKYMLEESHTSLILSRKSLLSGLDGFYEYLDFDSNEFYSGKRNVSPDEEPGSNNLAYIMYTSGSTGLPKGVMVEHHNVIRLVKKTNYVEFSEGTRILQTGAPVFDATTFEVWGSLLNGGGLYFVERDILLDAHLLEKDIVRSKINTLWLTAPLFNRLIEQNSTFISKLRYLLVGGDILSPTHINKARKSCESLTIINGYGPTENTTFSTYYLIEKTFKEQIPIGKPICNSTAYILDKNLELLPIGIVGELFVGGEGISRGYLNCPELTAEKFIRAPFAKGFKLFRTGDLARWLPDGNIEFIGRTDYQVKIRGFRVELGEIENILLKHGEIRDVIVLAKEDENRDKYLCSYYMANKKLKADELKQYLSKHLPAYMIPVYLVQLEKIPLNLNGKIDIKQLPAPDAGFLRKEYAAPQDDMEKMLAAIWSQILRIDKKKIGVHSRFFDIGGHSLKAMSLMSRIHKEFSVRIPVENIFRSPTIKGICQYIKNAAKDKYFSVAAAEKKEYYTLSSTQKRMYFIQQLDLKGTYYNVNYVLTTVGKVNIKKLNQVFTRLIKRHESFRTSFFMIKGEPVQRIQKTAAFAIEHHKPAIQHQKECKSLDKDEASLSLGKDECSLNLSIEKIIHNFIRYFDLYEAPLLRVGLIKVGEEMYYMMVDMHHIISDGASIEILIQEFMTLYTGGVLPELYVQYKSFSEWECSEKNRDWLNSRKKYWLKQFEKEIPALDLPTDYHRPKTKSYEGSRLYFDISKNEYMQLTNLALKEDVTLYMLLLAAFNVLLFKLTGREDLIVGTPIAGRVYPDVEHVIGMFVNTLALRNFPKREKTFLGFLREVKVNVLGAFENQDFQFDDLINHLTVERDPGRNPLFDVMFAMLKLDIAEIKIHGLRFKNYNYHNKVSKFDLMLVAQEEEGRLFFIIEYCTELFKEKTIAKFTEYFKKIISAIIKNPQRKISALEPIHIDDTKPRMKLPLSVNKTEKKKYYPTTSEQKRLFNLNLLKKEDKYGHISEVVILPGDVNRHRLTNAFKKIINRHEPLRKSFEIVNGEVLQRIHKNIGFEVNFFEAADADIEKILTGDTELREIEWSKESRSLSSINKKRGGIDNFDFITAAEKKKSYILSAAQAQLFFFQYLAPENTAFNMPVFHIVEGQIDKEKFDLTFKKLINSHEGLRTSFELIDGKPVQVIHEEAEFETVHSVSFNYNRAIRDKKSDGETVPLPFEVERAMDDFLKPFDLSAAPLLRVELLELEEEKHILMFDMHHIISDGISNNILIRDFTAFYKGEAVPELRIQYKDFCEWQNRIMAEEAMKRQENHWLDLFQGDIPVPDLPTDYERQPIPDYRGNNVTCKIGVNRTAKLKKIGSESGSTLYMILLSGFTILLAKYSDREDIVVGSYNSGRNHPQLENIIGMFLNTLMMRNYPVGDKTYIEFLDEVKVNTLKAFENQDFQFEKLIEKLSIERDPFQNPFFNTMFILQNIPKAASGENDIKFIPYKSDNRMSKFDITLEAVEIDDGINFRFNYRKSLFKKETVEKMAGDYTRILNVISENRDIKIKDIELESEILTLKRARLEVKFNI